MAADSKGFGSYQLEILGRTEAVPGGGDNLRIIESYVARNGQALKA